MTACPGCGFTYGELPRHLLAAQLGASGRFDRHDRQRPAVVAAQVAMAADARRDLEWVAHHTRHEMVHHLADIDHALGAP
jgi:hypothetical protein